VKIAAEKSIVGLYHCDVKCIKKRVLVLSFVILCFIVTNNNYFKCACRKWLAARQLWHFVAKDLWPPNSPGLNALGYNMQGAL